MTMFHFAFGLLLFHLLWLLVPTVFFLFVVVPFFMNLFDGKGYGYNAGRVWHGVRWFLSLGFKRRSQFTVTK
jgi:hypothetical protein